MGIYADTAEQIVLRRIEDRNSIDILRSRVNLLRGTDRGVMKMYLAKGIDIKHIARWAGITVPRITRRINKLSRSLLDGDYLICLQNGALFSDYEMDIARDYFLMNISVRQMAAQRGRSSYQIYKTISKIKKLTGILKRTAAETI